MAWSAGAILTAAQLNTYLPQAWTSYTPTLTGTGTTQGNATMTGGYIQYGKTTLFWARAVRGTTTVNGSSLSLSLPATARNVDDAWISLYGMFTDAATAEYDAQCRGGTASVSLYVRGASGAYSAPSATVPFTWGTGDKMYAAGIYEAA